MLKGNEPNFAFLILEAGNAPRLRSSKYKRHHPLHFIPITLKLFFFSPRSAKILVTEKIIDYLLQFILSAMKI